MMARFLRRLVAHKKSERDNRKSIHEIFQEQKKAKEEEAAALIAEMAKKNKVMNTAATKGKENGTRKESNEVSFRRSLGTETSSSLLLSRYDGVMADDDDVGDLIHSHDSIRKLSIPSASEGTNKSGGSGTGIGGGGSGNDNGGDELGSGWKMVGIGKHAVFVKINSQRFSSPSHSPTHSPSQSPYHSLSSTPRDTSRGGGMGIKSPPPLSPSSLASSLSPSPLFTGASSRYSPTTSPLISGNNKTRLPGLQQQQHHQQQQHQSEQLQQTSPNTTHSNNTHSSNGNNTHSNKKAISFRSTRLVPLEITTPASPSSSFSSPMSSPSRLSPLHSTPISLLPSPSGVGVGVGVGLSSSSPSQSYKGNLSSSSSQSYQQTMSISSPQSPSGVMLSFLSTDDNIHMDTPPSQSPVSPTRPFNTKNLSMHNLTWSPSKRDNNNNNNNNQSEHHSSNSSQPSLSNKSSLLLASSSSKRSGSDRPREGSNRPREGGNSNTTSIRSATITFDSQKLSQIDGLPIKKENPSPSTVSMDGVDSVGDFKQDSPTKEIPSYHDSPASKKIPPKHNTSSAPLLSTFTSSSIDNTVRRSRLLPKRRSTMLNREVRE